MSDEKSKGVSFINIKKIEGKRDLLNLINTISELKTSKTYPQKKQDPSLPSPSSNIEAWPYGTSLCFVSQIRQDRKPGKTVATVVPQKLEGFIQFSKSVERVDERPMGPYTHFRYQTQSKIGPEF